ncbi:MAG: aldehyde reductase [Bacteroidetes bacterium]|nr:aldehyde reductase [Bacteroidota bacterium]
MSKQINSKPILVTGASGYIASWIVKFLLEDGHKVHATVRDKSNTKKTAHFQKIANNTSGELVLFEADLLKKGSFREAAEGCEIIIHTASPFKISGIKNAHKELIEPALEGTRNVLETANDTLSVNRVALTSSVVSIYGDAIDVRETENGIFTEKDWNTTSSPAQRPYNYSKTVAEKEAWRMAKEQERWDLVVLNPAFVLGPSLSDRTDSTSVDFMRNMVNGKLKTGVPDFHFAIVDVRDVAKAHVLAATNSSSKGRHILASGTMSMMEIAKSLTEKYGDRFPIPKGLLPKVLLYIFGPLQGFSWKYLNRNHGIPMHFDNSYTIKDLGMEFRPIKESLYDQMEQLIASGLVS